jgi:hypothetical protein
MTFNTNKNVFQSTIFQLRGEVHGFQTFQIPKSTKTQKLQKTRLVKSLTDTIDEMNTDDFGIRIIVLKTIQ